MSTRATWMIGVGLLVVCVAFSGLSIPLIVVEDGVEELSSDASRELASRALVMADTLMDHPLERIVFPAARIESIRYRPGHCLNGAPGSNHREADWIVSVRYYTFFALRGPRVIATCGARHGEKRW